MIQIDGAFGEGGGQILRTSLALSLVTGQPFQIAQIRANRKKPGLRRQHLTAVNAAMEIGRAEVHGNSLGSMELRFAPQTIHPGAYHFDIGSAGSCTLVLQTILPALFLARGPSELVLEGGTHNPYAPTFDFLQRVFFPILRKMGGSLTAVLDRPGFYPAGGGKIRLSLTPTDQLLPIELLTRGAVKKHQAHALLSRLPRHIADRELREIRAFFGWPPGDLFVDDVPAPRGPGNVLTVIVVSEHITEVFTGFGERGVRAETVARRTAGEVQAYLDANVPVGRYLADQLLIPMALAGGGKFRTLAPTQHTLTNIAVVQQFLNIQVTLSQLSTLVWEIALSRQAGHVPLSTVTLSGF